MSVVTHHSQRSMLLQRTTAMLSALTDDELSAMETVAKTFLMNRAAEGYPHPLTEQQLFERIDRSLSQAKSGMYQDAEEVEAELAAEFGL